MKFFKGMMLGTAITAGAMMMYSGSIDLEKKKMLKKGKHLMKKMGL